MNSQASGEPSILASAFHEALNLCQRGDFLRADGLCAEILRVQPAHFDALHLRGLMALERGDAALGFDMIRRSLELNPNQPPAYSNLGNGLLKAGRAEEALDCFDAAVQLKPDYMVALYNRGNALRELGKFNEALSSYERALRLKQDYFPALNQRVRVLLDLNRAEEALASSLEMIRLSGESFEARLNCGDSFARLQRFAEALEAYDKALSQTPDSAGALLCRGNALQALGRFEDAVFDYERALSLDSASIAAMTNMGIALLRLRRAAEALPLFDDVVRRGRAGVEALVGRAQALEAVHRHREAVACLERLLLEYPNHEYAVGNIVQMRLDGHEWSRHGASMEALASGVEQNLKVVKPFTMLAVSSSAAAQLRCARIYGSGLRPDMEPLPFDAKAYGHRKIRLAYVSGDLREHAVSYLMAGVFENHDREDFETIAISFRREENTATGTRVKAAFDRFIDVSERSDLEVARLMRHLEVDIAVDLAGFTGNARTEVFRYRPAPVHANYLGFPGTVGAPFMDYILADDFVIPAESRGHYGEQIVLLPDCFQANDDRRAIAPMASRRGAGLPDAAFVFCSFNNSYKINPAMFDIWCRLLLGCPGSVLWLVADGDERRKNLLSEAAARGVGADRIIFADRLPYPEHLARLRLADLFLDTLPFNAGTTASDALWAGLPVLTCAGESFASRMAGSLLRAVGLPELCTGNLTDYERLGTGLAANPHRIQSLRARLSANRGSAPLWKTRRHCRHLESAYRQMWLRAERGEPPVSFAVTPLA